MPLTLPTKGSVNGDDQWAGCWTAQHSQLHTAVSAMGTTRSSPPRLQSQTTTVQAGCPLTGRTMAEPLIALPEALLLA